MPHSPITAKVVLDGVLHKEASAGYLRITTLEVTMPKFLVAQFNTHRVFSRNSASSRAIPINKTIANVLESPVHPEDYGMPANGKGMQPKANLTGWRAFAAGALWSTAMYLMIVICWLLSKVGLHKQWTNRLLEPFIYTKVLVTSTEWDNFIKLRMHSAAQDAMFEVAVAISCALADSTPTDMEVGHWYLPYVGIFKNTPTTEQFDISVSCCAQVSFRTNDMSSEKAKRVVNSLLNDDIKHWSPFEHIARARLGQYANYYGFESLRHVKESVC